MSAPTLGNAGDLAFEVEIMGKNYKIQCTQESQADLLASARLVNDKIASIKAGDAILSQDRERIVVTMALNLAYELVTKKRAPKQAEDDAVIDDAEQKVDALQDMVETAIKQP